jgi:hypothetical protein
MAEKQIKPLSVITVGGRAYEVYGSEHHESSLTWHDYLYIVISRRMEGDPGEFDGGYHPYCYPSAVCWPVQPLGWDTRSGRGWPGVPEATTRSKWQIKDEANTRVLGYAPSREATWHLAAETLHALVAARFDRS